MINSIKIPEFTENAILIQHSMSMDKKDFALIGLYTCPCTDGSGDTGHRDATDR